ncbi:UNVERIFIED_CONTAM: RICIN domain-containing protein, partial [Bacteroidetes bacterium 56_B9]
CFTAGTDPVIGDTLVLGDCEQEWTFDSDGTIRAGNGQCVNIAKEDNKVQVWECNPYDEQGSEYFWEYGRAGAAIACR